MNIKHLETKNSRITSQTINGFAFKAFLFDSTVGPMMQFGSSKVDFSKCTVKAILNRDGVDHILFQDNLKILGLASSLNTRGQLAFYSSNDHFTKLADGRSLCAFEIPLGGPIRIAGDDYVYLEVTAQDGLFIGNEYLPSSYLEVKPLKAIGYETFIPTIKSFNIQAGTSSDTYSLGDNVLRTVLLNFDKTDFTNPVVTNLNFASDRLNLALNYTDLVGMKNASFPPATLSGLAEASVVFESDQSFVVTDFGQKFNALVLDIQFDGDQVLASKNYIVIWSSKTDLKTLQAAADLQQKHTQAEIAAIPSSVK